MIVINIPQTTISFKDWEKFILPVLKDRQVSSMILYKIECGVVRIRTHMDGFVVVTRISIGDVREMYKDQNVEVGMEAPPEISESDLLNKLNQDFMDSRGIPELE